MSKTVDTWGEPGAEHVDPRDHFVVDLDAGAIVAGPFEDPERAEYACPPGPTVMAVSEGVIDLLNLCGPTELADARGDRRE